MSQKKKPKSSAESETLYAPHVLDVGISFVEVDGIVVDDPRFDRRVLALGDDWFRLDQIPGGALLPQLEFKQSTLVVCTDIANADAIASLLEADRRPKFDLVLLSAGLREMLAGIDAFVLKNPHEEKNPINALDIDSVRHTLDTIRKQIERLAELRGRKTPLLAHTYDYLTVRPSGLAGSSDCGPWLYPVMQRRGIVPKLQTRIADYVIESLAETIKALQESERDFHVVDTLGTLVRADVHDIYTSGDWLSEVHPNPRGLRKLAAALQPRIHKLLR